MEHLPYQINALRKALRSLEEAPPGLNQEIDLITDSIRERENELRHERITALGHIAEAMEAAAFRLKAALSGETDVDLEELDLSSLGTMFGHFDRAFDELTGLDDGAWTVV